MNPEETYLQNLRTIERIAAFVARRHHLATSEVEEFVQETLVRLLDDDYAVIRKFEGRSSFSTYLNTVIGRLFTQWRVEQWGKWRPSAEAKRLGDKAVTLERLLSREGFTLAEAVRMLTTGDMPYTISELEAIYMRLPSRTPRPIVVADDTVPDVMAVEADAYERLEASDRTRTLQQALRKMDDLIQKMDAEDRLILQMRFWDGRRVPDIARALHLDQKKLYKRLDRLFLLLRRELESAGVAKSDLASLMVDGDQEIQLHILPVEEIASIGPSHGRGGDDPGRGGEGRPR
jgi:RNA polymerase sigma factor for flagellar operon FliA